MGYGGDRNEAGKEKQTEKTAKELEAERKQGEGFHGSLKKTVFQYGLRGDESGQ